ncbi:CoA-transferase family III [Neolentinus lepideus HHB14362 ss-1]|uniref:CoA-transferase family III n=1 Tax=Neolentinus lepideus HHB14362 ss-1 TaxID=1314782 RepID=A0A165UWX9_9AGAM|nr:CoA-transferase family III [Neolentinus lepideus HHB14362 ss-1]
MTLLEPTHSAARTLWDDAGLPLEELSHLRFSLNADPAVDSSFKLGTAAQTTIGLSGLSAAYFHKLRTAQGQEVSVDARHAVLEFKSENWYTIDGRLEGSGSLWDDIAGLYSTADGYIRIHTNFPHHRRGILDILQCEPNRGAVARALSTWNFVEFETEAASRKMCATALRSFDQWEDHPQGRALRGVAPICLIKVGDAPKRKVEGQFDRPLDGIRVMDLTRVLAGPVCGRTLAAHGADVLWITSPKLPSLPLIDVETSRGKRTTQLDLTNAADTKTCASLVKEADVFLQAYRPGGLEDKGFGIADVVRQHPGIVYASLTAYGWEGPWKDRRGFDSLVQTATGFNVAEGQAYAAWEGVHELAPRPLPMQALDHAAGYLLAFGINAALARTITEGGSWEVRVSLAAVGQWIRSLGRLESQIGFAQGAALPPRTYPLSSEIANLSTTIQECWGSNNGETERKPAKIMTAIRHAAILSRTPVREGEAPMSLNKHAAEWLPRKVARGSLRLASTVV